ncbi:hypothetical protein DBR37_05870 [Herminiimonas sp. KBW02]|uniref:hypothetical protein n=1 Tax=Herminiimonas sp. KBW02 TaxID=2153363 RepID=UPI000F59D3F1|nr:hypothetical protein [Herminiimonas sp. KBW02]RQO35885.1 hypothetical protein DBR37_05870 [Herminiimonas sp. KBW02]
MSNTDIRDTDDKQATPSEQAQESDLNNASPTPPPDAQIRLRKNAEESHKLDTPERTNDSTIDPNKPKEDILKGFHGG